MNRRHLLIGLISVPGIVGAQSLGNLAGALKDPLMGLLSNQLGVTDNQAKGGLGSLLTLAREKLPVADFTKIAKLVPGADNYMTLAKTLGAVSGPLKNLAGLNASLGKLGMTPEVVAKFVPTVSNYLGKVGGNQVSSLLATVLK